MTISKLTTVYKNVIPIAAILKGKQLTIELLLGEKMDKIEIFTNVITSIGVIVSLVLGIIGIVFTQQQIALSNKQALFDKRYECYRLLTHIHSLCEQNLRLINTGEKERYIAVDFVTSLLTNSVDFYKMTNVFQGGRFTI